MKNATDWRSTFLQFCGPGMLAGIRLGDWTRLLRSRELSLDLARFPRMASITAQSVKTSLIAGFEKRKYEGAWQQVQLHPPLFVLGHWRSGTTYLHELLAQDPQFGFPTSFQVSFPHTFLTTEKTDLRWLAPFVPRRRPMDNMEMSLLSPQEDEFALAVSTLKSPCLAWVFPAQKEQFEKYLTFAQVAPAEVAEWRQAFVTFLKKVQLRCDRPLVLKSPPHTARVRLLLEMFPGARFVHIHRDPFRVFQSTRRTFQIISRWHGLQRSDSTDWDELILRQYHQMYEALFADRQLIPPGHYHEIAFEQLEQDPPGEIRKTYDALELPGFSAAEARLRTYVNSLAGYEKNRFTTLPPNLREQIARYWGRCFDEWGYHLQPA